MIKNNKKKGFTLIELMVVIAIIGLLSSIVLVSLKDAKTRATDAKIMAEYNQMKIAFELYRNTNGKYPATVLGTSYCIGKCVVAEYSGIQPLSSNSIPAFTYTPSSTVSGQNSGFIYVNNGTPVVYFSTEKRGWLNAVVGIWNLSEGSSY